MAEKKAAARKSAKKAAGEAGTAQTHTMLVDPAERPARLVGGPLEGMGGMSMAYAAEAVSRDDLHGPAGAVVLDAPPDPSEDGPALTRWCEYVPDGSDDGVLLFNGYVDPPPPPDDAT